MYNKTGLNLYSGAHAAHLIFALQLPKLLLQLKQSSKRRTCDSPRVPSIILYT